METNGKEWLFQRNEFHFVQISRTEAQKFINLVCDFLATFSKTAKIGIFKTENKFYSSVISKPNTLFYKIIDIKSLIYFVFIK
jgi:hypothetical protein